MMRYLAILLLTGCSSLMESRGRGFDLAVTVDSKEDGCYVQIEGGDYMQTVDRSVEVNR